MKERVRKALGFLGLIEDEYGEYGAGAPARPFTEEGYDEPEWSAPAPAAPRPAAALPSARASRTLAPAPASEAPRLRPVPSGRIRTLSSHEDEVAVVEPVGYDDSRRITDALRARRAVLLNVGSLDAETARRVVDFTSGTLYALRAKIERLAPGVYLISYPDAPVSPETRLRLRASGYRSSPAP
jgi:FtsZ-interacting cell division protein YlmF